MNTKALTLCEAKVMEQTSYGPIQVSLLQGYLLQCIAFSRDLGSYLASNVVFFFFFSPFFFFFIIDSTSAFFD